MNKDYFKDIYSDFFNNYKLENNSILSDEENSQSMTGSLFDRIDNLSIDDDSKELFKKIVSYMESFDKGSESNYVPFRIIVNTNSNDCSKDIISIMESAISRYNYTDSKDKKTISLTSYDNSAFDNLGYLIIDKISGISKFEEKDASKFYTMLEEFLEKNKKSVVIVSGTKKDVDNFFIGREDFKRVYFGFNINGVNPDVHDIYEYVLNKIDATDDMKVSLLDFISKTYNDSVDYTKYQTDLVEYISFYKELPKLKENKTLDEVFSELNELVGLDKVKKVLHELVDVISLKEKAGDNLKIKDLNLHMVFLGNPGTGKTTVARIVANILYNLGYIKENKLVEVSVKDLVAEYVGQTAPKTNAVIEKSLGGVLFIDEAYALADKGDNTFNAEAIATLIQAMENYRNNLVVIFAGYTKEMQDFLDSNSGIVSRIGYTLTFDDYTTDELIQIFLGFMSKSGFVVEDDAIEYLRDIIEENRNMKNFGNARFVRNIYEKTVVKHASNVKDKKQKKILRTITKEDINVENLIMK